MNRHFLPRLVRWAWVVLLLTPAVALAQSPYEGTYIGDYRGPGYDGEFALIVNDQGYGRLAAFDAVDGAGYIEDNIRVGFDGSFRFVTPYGVRVNGQLTASQVSGHYSRGNRQGGFSAPGSVRRGPAGSASRKCSSVTWL